MSGGNYYVSFDEILSSAHLRRLQLFLKLNFNSEIDHVSCEGVSTCCTSLFSDDEIALIDAAAQKLETISLPEKSALFYISGYVSFKLKITRGSEMNEPTIESEFTTLVSRGKLQYPRTISTVFLYRLCIFLLFT